MHRIAAMTAVAEMDKEKRSAAGAMPVFPGMPAFFPSPATSQANFPGIFPQQQMQQFYANLLQQHFLQLASAQSAAASPNGGGSGGGGGGGGGGASRNDLSPSLSTSSREDSPSVRKLQLGEDGCPICPVCLERLPENEWADHVIEERNKLVTHIQEMKEKKVNGTSSVCTSPTDGAKRHKREFDLARIRSNQQKRLALKRGPVLPLPRESLTPFSRQSNEDSGSTVASPEDLKKDDDFGSGIKCSACGRASEYGIVSGSFEQPRCQECFDRLRAQTGVLPLTLGGAPLDMSSSALETLQDLPLSLVTSAPAEKRLKLETTAC